MSRSFVITALLLSVALAGCAEEVKDDPRFRIDPAEAEIAATKGYSVPGASEVDLVEQVAADRNAYRQNLEILAAYYSTTGNEMKSKWAERELDSLMQYRYLMPAEIGSAYLRATESIGSADMLFEDAMKLYKDAGGLVVIIDEGKLKAALAKFNLLISQYPTSDKIDDSAYRAGRIYDHFGDYEIAVVYYQRTFQWNEATAWPARFRAAYTFDQKLRMRKEALPLYRLSYEFDKQYEANIEYARRRIKKLSDPLPKEEDIESGEAGDTDAAESE